MEQCSLYITNLDVTRWCWENASKHVCPPPLGDVSQEESCPICLDPLVHDSKVLEILCGNTMHLECADKWFSTCIMSAKAAKCPLCNLVVLCPVFKRVSEAVFLTESWQTQTVSVDSGSTFAEWLVVCNFSCSLRWRFGKRMQNKYLSIFPNIMIVYCLPSKINTGPAAVEQRHKAPGSWSSVGGRTGQIAHSSKFWRLCFCRLY